MKTKSLLMLALFVMLQAISAAGYATIADTSQKQLSSFEIGNEIKRKIKMIDYSGINTQHAKAIVVYTINERGIVRIVDIKGTDNELVHLLKEKLDNMEIESCTILPSGLCDTAPGEMHIVHVKYKRV